MTETITKAMKRPGMLAALLAGAGVFVTQLLIGFVQTLLSTAYALTTAPSRAPYIGAIWSQRLQDSLSGMLPFAVGVFLCFWQIAPIAPVLRLAHVVTRSLLAGAVGAAVMWLVNVVFQLIVDVVHTPFSTPAAEVLGQIGPDVLQAFFRALAVATAYLPVTVLAGILLWGWLQRHPLDTPVHGALDEV